MAVAAAFDSAVGSSARASMLNPLARIRAAPRIIPRVLIIGGRPPVEGGKKCPTTGGLLRDQDSGIKPVNSADEERTPLCNQAGFFSSRHDKVNRGRSASAGPGF